LNTVAAKGEGFNAKAPETQGPIIKNLPKGEAMLTPEENRMELTPQERRLKTLLRILALVLGLAVLIYLLPALAGPNKAAFIHLPFVTNSAVKVEVPRSSP
jgi:hypothetical protein